jgi:hypothetical protein
VKGTICRFHTCPDICTFHTSPDNS